MKLVCLFASDTRQSLLRFFFGTWSRTTGNPRGTHEPTPIADPVPLYQVEGTVDGGFPSFFFSF